MIKKTIFTNTIVQSERFPGASLTHIGHAEIDLSLPIEGRINAGAYGWICQVILSSGKFPAMLGGGIIRARFALLSLGEEAETEEVDDLIAGLTQKEKWESAPIDPLLEVGIAYPELQGDTWVIALGSRGSVDVGEGLVEVAPALSHSDEDEKVHPERRLSLQPLKGLWNENIRFLLVQFE